MSEFTDLITIAEMTPGPIAVNSATFVGIRIAGLPGAVIATMGCIFPSCIIVSLLAYIYYRYKNVSTLQSVLSSLRPTVVALIASAGLSILKTVVFAGKAMTLENINWIGFGIFGIAFFDTKKMENQSDPGDESVRSRPVDDSIDRWNLNERERVCI